ncbi:MAG: hypothetical protein P8P16_04885 [Amylibacter sp.]|nr:hypothetical protein [Amylibacter sp.]
MFNNKKPAMWMSTPTRIAFPQSTKDGANVRSAALFLVGRAYLAAGLHPYRNVKLLV